MPRDYKTSLEDIGEAVSKIRKYTAGLSLDDLSSDEKTLDAVIRNLEVIGEAAKNIPNDIRNRYPSVEWKRVGGLRDILIHQYFGIDLDIIWDIVINKLPILSTQIQQILEEES